ncbi:hypothetical protein [Mucilaginibacter sp.]|uniref:hypothetical protein n=1 Tax=Mucilaginibacter sp. TaxID=1882438 RepID=UPI003265F0C5
MGLFLAIIFYKIGSKRVIGGFTNFMYCLLIWPIGIFMVLNSRRLDDEEANAALLKEFSSN